MIDRIVPEAIPNPVAIFLLVPCLLSSHLRFVHLFAHHNSLSICNLFVLY